VILYAAIYVTFIWQIKAPLPLYLNALFQNAIHKLIHVSGKIT
jgi:hypothetical protein